MHDSSDWHIISTFNRADVLADLAKNQTGSDFEILRCLNMG